jgi:formate dehydrogenase subunit gamma
VTVTATEPAAPVARTNRRTRLLHTATYLVTLVLLATGWWLETGHDGQPSILARLAGEPDIVVHRRAGWVLAAIAAVAVTAGARGARTFVRETVRANRGDLRWLWRWPTAAATGRFPRHRGHFDPGQRLANVGFVVTLGTLIGTGIALAELHGGPAFVWLVRVHRWSAVALTVLVVGHVLVASGLLPGYRGAWRAMHLGGRVPAATADRLWPEDSTLDRSARDSDGRPGAFAGRTTTGPGGQGAGPGADPLPVPTAAARRSARRDPG